MTSREFKSRYLKVLKESFKEAPDEVRPGLEERFSRFVTFPAALLERSSLSQEAQEFLTQVGLPKAAAPALNFQDLYELHPELESHPFLKDFFLLGTADRQRLLAIDKESDEVLCLDLSEEVVEPLFVNSSLDAFAECLCLFQEHRESNELDTCLQAMHQVDSMLSEYYSFWEEETQNFFDNVLDRLNEAAGKARQ